MGRSYLPEFDAKPAADTKPATVARRMWFADGSDTYLYRVTYSNKTTVKPGEIQRDRDTDTWSAILHTTVPIVKVDLTMTEAMEYVAAKLEPMLSNIEGRRQFIEKA